MEGDLRYKVEHVGDNLVGMLSKLIGPSKSSSRGEEAGTGKDLRYKLEHIGDSFVGVIGNVSGAAKASARGVVLTYDKRQVIRKRERLISAIGAHIAQISKENPSFSQDEETRGLLAQLAEAEKKFNSLMEERQTLLEPTKSRRGCCSAETTTQAAPDELPQSA